MNKFDKHGFILKKPKIRKVRLILRALLTLFVCGYALHRCSLSAAAVQQTTLTPEQTLALLGLSLPADYNNVDTGLHETINFDFVGTSLDWVPNDAESGTYLDIRGTYNLSGAAEITWTAAANIQPWLVYRSIVSDYRMGSAASVRFTFDLPFTISGITAMDGGAMLSYGMLYGFDQEGSFYSSDFRVYDTQGGLTRQTLYGTTQDQQYMFIVPTYKPNTSFGNLDDEKTGVFAFSPWRGYYQINHSGNTFNLQRITANWRSARGIYRSAILGSDTALYILVQCPTFTSNDPLPPMPGTTTVTTSTTPAPTTTRFQTATLPETLDTRLDVIIENQNTQIVELNEIIDILNRIYTKMVVEGAVNPDLVEGLEPPAPELLRNFINDALTAPSTSTTAYILDGIFAPYFGLGAALAGYDVFKPWLYVGGFVMVFAVVCWFIFYGRKG